MNSITTKELPVLDLTTQDLAWLEEIDACFVEARQNRTVPAAIYVAALEASSSLFEENRKLHLAWRRERRAFVHATAIAAFFVCAFVLLLVGRLLSGN